MHRLSVSFPSRFSLFYTVWMLVFGSGVHVMGGAAK